MIPVVNRNEFAAARASVCICVYVGEYTCLCERTVVAGWPAVALTPGFPWSVCRKCLRSLWILRNESLCTLRLKVLSW